MSRFNKDIFKNLRTAFKFSQQEIAEELGVSQKRVSRWELGTVKPNNVELHKIAIFATSKVGVDGAYNITGLDNVDPESLPELEAKTRSRIILIAYKSGKIEWMPYQLNTLETISTSFAYIEDIQIIEKGA